MMPVAPMTRDAYTCVRICRGVGIVHGPDSKACSVTHTGLVLLLIDAANATF